MGNCQAVDTATLVIQHPGGKVERYYWPMSASEVMRTNPGHYVALVLTLCLPPDSSHHTHNKDDKQKEKDQQHHPQQQRHTTTTTNNNNEVRITRVKVLRPTDTLVLGQAYRLVTSQEVMKGLWARKCAKKKKDNATESADKSLRLKPNQHSSSACETESISTHLDKPNQVQVVKHERHRPRIPSAPSASTRSRPWRPSLQSISEAAQAER
ncbi:uncharacterized protein LOC122077348 isoform X2 [Macadamia integrifolia]|uniref:uncharacterized protein LOC122077348 isoform X2 n=1 Tax=Macadamia integrifolia TaxID=60698 RepID=UPI001C4E99EA|nr:uncharacterized protein LOC122077348 isoform X2 [Macadamia integrifolia]